MRSLTIEKEHTSSLPGDLAALSARSMVFCLVEGEIPNAAASVGAARERLYQIAFAKALEAVAAERRQNKLALCLN